MAKADASWKEPGTGRVYNCGYGSSTTVTDHIIKGTTLYHAGTKVVLDDDVEMAALRGWVYFSTCKARCKQFSSEVQTFVLSQNLPAEYVGRQGGDEFATDFFGADPRRIAYFSDKECEVVIRSNYLNQYLERSASASKGIWYYLCCCLPCCRRS